MKFNYLVNKLKKRKEGKPLLAVLIDPDKFNLEVVKLANQLKVTCFLVGGSKLETGNLKQTVREIKASSTLPVILFPGDETQLCPEADGLFLPTLLSGRNPEYLIGKQVIMAPIIRKMKLPGSSMAYLLINGKNASSTQKVTNTKPLHPRHSASIKHTAMAAEQMGFQLLYLEAGSGAKTSVPASVIKAVKKTVSLPVIVGGGINSAARAKKVIEAGADMLVIGNALEKDVYLLAEISSCF